ncbi:hypothetical protein [Paracoccus saliphilus]|uniref:Electron transfer flavoprotein beta subunit n=1 Tax=Paracoccus saliphilus TaxID=405559 RepID=A0AA45W7V9_9RHOB|nr:hypothetical protein [Paracoccus saliphilus]SIT12472.1 hypothetical protein SAMN05421772_12140 [Paracoccus saliphilus]
MKLLVTVKRVVDYNVKIRVKLAQETLRTALSKGPTMPDVAAA